MKRNRRWRESEKMTPNSTYCLSDSLGSPGLQSIKFLCPCNFPGKNTGVGCHFLLQGIFQPRDRPRVSGIVGRCFYRLSHQGSHTYIKQKRACLFLVWVQAGSVEEPGWRGSAFERHTQRSCSTRAPAWLTRTHASLMRLQASLSSSMRFLFN